MEFDQTYNNGRAKGPEGSGASEPSSNDIAFNRKSNQNRNHNRDNVWKKKAAIYIHGWVTVPSRLIGIPMCRLGRGVHLFCRWTKVVLQGPGVGDQHQASKMLLEDLGGVPTLGSAVGFTSLASSMVTTCNRLGV